MPLSNVYRRRPTGCYFACSVRAISSLYSAVRGVVKRILVGSRLCNSSVPTVSLITVKPTAFALFATARSASMGPKRGAAVSHKPAVVLPLVPSGDAVLESVPALVPSFGAVGLAANLEVVPLPASDAGVASAGPEALSPAPDCSAESAGALPASRVVEVKIEGVTVGRGAGPAIFGSPSQAPTPSSGCSAESGLGPLPGSQLASPMMRKRKLAAAAG